MARARAVIDRQVQHLSRLVDDLLDVSRVTTGKVLLARQPLDLAGLVASAMSTWRAAGRFDRHHVSAQLAAVWVAPPRRILVIEDNDDAREMLRVALTLVGHTVYEAADGHAGVAAARDTEPDVALVDVGLPLLDGYEVARQIRAGANGKAIRLIAITGYGQAEDRRRAREAGFDAHLTKPVVPEQLAAALYEG